MQTCKKDWLGILLVSALSALTLTVLADIAYVWLAADQMWQEQSLTLVKFSAVFAALFAVFLVLLRKSSRIWRTVVTAFSLLIWIVSAAGWFAWNTAANAMQYVAVDSGKEELYGGQRIMLLVPHQDDDINVLGGVVEEYGKYGSEVYVVFSTNGDYYGLSEVRYREAVNALSIMGVPEDHVLFLGYGDQWNADGPHLYNAQPGVVVESVFGSTETYGTPWHPAYREGNAYTMDNFLGDLESVILEYKPDVLYCVDYDYNIDHKALMLSFEKVMGRILNSDGTYRPLVYKGYAYNTAWEAEWDFYGENLRSTQNVFEEPYMQQPAIYRWEDRVRLPVHAEALSRSAVRSAAHEALAAYASQNAGLHAPRIINSDKVFWLRDTNSLCYGADIQTSSGTAERLNDFMLLDNTDLKDGSHMPYDGVWIPAQEDMEKTVSVIFGDQKTVNAIVLYDHPDPTKNVLNAEIVLDSGTSLQTGPLEPDGAATQIQVGGEVVTSFTVRLLETEGDAGLTEVEAYEIRAIAPAFVKLMDEAENFVYDYWITAEGYQQFGLYVSGDLPAASEEAYALSCDNEKCTAKWSGDRILVNCPAGESCTITVMSQDGTVSDAVFVQNPGRLERWWKMLLMDGENHIMQLCDKVRFHERLVICRLWTKIPQKLESVFG